MGDSLKLLQRKTRKIDDLHQSNHSSDEHSKLCLGMRTATVPNEHGDATCSVSFPLIFKRVSLSNEHQQVDIHKKKN